MKPTVKVSWSGGKDSTCAVLLHLEAGHKVKAAMELCRHCDLLSPLYEHYKRDGCALCPNAPRREREQWFREFPEAVPIVKKLQDKVKAEKPENHTPLRNHEWFL